VPLKLIPPRPGKTPYWSVRGTYLGQFVDRSTKAGKRAVAKQVLEKWEREIERDEFASTGTHTFASAALAYMKSGGERRFVTPLLHHFKETTIRQIDQIAIDAAAQALYPNASPATRNRQVYTPTSAILKYVGADHHLKRPKGADGKTSTAWLWPEEANRLFTAAKYFDEEFAALLITLCYTGMRLSESLNLSTDNVRLLDGFAYVPDSKNGEPRAVFLPPCVVSTLANHPRGMDRPGEPVFRFRKNGHLYALLRAAAARAGVTLPERQAFHIFCHTYATWMRRFAGLDTKGLVATGRWKDRKSADRYEHVVVSEESKKAALLPTPKTISRA